MSNTQLTNASLLAQIKTLGDVSKADLVSGCGYIKGEAPNYFAFYKALQAAKKAN
jgi:hypothetical protein